MQPLLKDSIIPIGYVSGSLKMPSAFISPITVRGFLEELNTFEENVKKKIKIIITLDNNDFIFYYYLNHYLFQY